MGLSLFLRVRSEAGGLGAEVGVQGFVAEEGAVGGGAGAAKIARFEVPGLSPPSPCRRKAGRNRAARAAGWRSWPTAPTATAPVAAGSIPTRSTMWAPTSPAGFGHCCPKLRCRWRRSPGTRTPTPAPGGTPQECGLGAACWAQPHPRASCRYTCPFVEKFSIEIETYYRPDAGQQTNIFNLSAAEKRQRILGACSRGMRQDPGLSLLTLCFRDRLSYPCRGKCPYPELPARSCGSAGGRELGNRVPILSSASPAPLGLCTVSFPVPSPPLCWVPGADCSPPGTCLSPVAACSHSWQCRHGCFGRWSAARHALLLKWRPKIGTRRK